MGKIRDLSNQTFGRLTAIAPTDKRTHGYAVWQCQCECGNVVEVRGDHLTNDHTRSCGCLKKETAAATGVANRKYQAGETDSRLYNIHASMRQRCYNPNHPEYHCYGGRCIKVCDEWKDFKKFKADAISHGYREGCGLTIDRIDNDGDYTPDNCQWLTRAENSHKQCVDKKKKRESSRPGKQSTLDGTPATASA